MTSTKILIREKKHLPDKNTRLFLLLLFVNVGVVLLPTWQGGILARFAEPTIISAMVLRVIRFVNLIVLFLIASNEGVRRNDLTVIIFLVFAAMMTSKFINITLEEITQPFEFLFISLVLFCSVKTNYINDNIFKIVTALFVAWSIIPVILLPIAPTSIQMALFATDPDANELTSTFCGFGTHRNAYAYNCGIAFVLTLFSDYKLIIKTVPMILMGIGLFLAASRSCILGLVIVSLFYFVKIHGKSKLLFVLFFTVAGYVFLTFAEQTESRLLETGGREDINKAAFQVYQEAPIFGHGKTTPTNLTSFVGVKTIPHNFIYSTLLDYGIVGLACFLLFLLIIFVKSSRNSRALLIYICVVGLFQPCFGLYAPSGIQLIIFLLMVAYNEKKRIESLCESHLKIKNKNIGRFDRVTDFAPKCKE